MPVPHARRALFVCAAVLLAPLAAPRAHAAEAVHLFAKDARGDIKGETAQKSLGRADSIECVEFELSAAVATEGPSGSGTGRMQMRPVRIVKRIDKASPRLMQDLVSSAGLGQCTFRFFRPNPAGDGTTQQFYTINLTGARIASIKQYIESTVSPATVSNPPLEEVTIVYRGLDCVYTDGGENARWGAAARPAKVMTAQARRAAQPAAARRPSAHGARIAAR